MEIPTSTSRGNKMPNAMYTANDENTFPVGPYMYSVTNAPISNVYHSYTEDYVDCYAVINEITKNGYKQIFRKYYKQDKKVSILKLVFEKKTENGLTIIMFGGMDTNPNMYTHREQAAIYSVNNEEECQYLEKLVIQNSHHIIEKVINNINLVIATSHGYDFVPFDLPKTELNIELNYGQKFVPIHEKIVNTLNTSNGKGLVLLHGLPGTGKTHYLKYLANETNKRILFIPPHMAEFITSPEMTPFLIENANSILFIEDAEKVITDRSVNASSGVSNILNLTDGILSDILNIQIVATFNMDKHKIDNALLRKGRLIAEHRFDVLSVEESDALLRHLKIDYTATEPMTLTQIYNVKEMEYKSEERRKIGF